MRPGSRAEMRECSRDPQLHPAGRRWEHRADPLRVGGLDYAAVGPEHAWLRDTGRATYTWVSDADAVDAFGYLGRFEGILPALESAHAIAYATVLARALGPDKTILVNLSGRGDKDVQTVKELAETDRGTRS